MSLNREVTHRIVQIESQLENDAVNSRRKTLRGGKHFFSTFLDLLQIAITVLISPKFWAKTPMNCFAIVRANFSSVTRMLSMRSHPNRMRQLFIDANSATRKTPRSNQLICSNEKTRNSSIIIFSLFVCFHSICKLIE